MRPPTVLAAGSETQDYWNALTSEYLTLSGALSSTIHGIRNTAVTDYEIFRRYAPTARAYADHISALPSDGVDSELLELAVRLRDALARFSTAVESPPGDGTTAFRIIDLEADFSEMADELSSEYGRAFQLR
jgi:hypothetical protein